MSVTYTDQVRSAAARNDAEAYVPVYARSRARKSNKPVKTWMILAPIGLLVVGGAAAAMLMQPATPAVEEAAPFAPLAAQLAASETQPLTAPSIPMETPAELTSDAPIPPSVAAPVELRATPVTPARAARVTPRVVAAEAVEAPVAPTGPQPYLSVAPQTAAPTVVAPSAPVAPTTPPAPIAITPPN
ncbi:hypothetical protein ACIQTU_13200 [Brevundimonas sp. NPDC090276]|uniref:hypothetical protein n=1 Tax=Brevundimonas sp. NPDC090276 TaxID=3363956 RepID=UPI00383ADF62